MTVEVLEMYKEVIRITEAYQAAYRLFACADPPSAIIYDHDALAVSIYKD